MKKLVKIFIWLMVSIVTFTAVYCSTLSVAKFSGAKIIIADAPKYVRRKIAGLGGTEGDLAGVGNPGSINLMLLSDPKVHAYVRDWFGTAKEVEDGKANDYKKHVTADNIYCLALTETGTYDGTYIPKSHLNVKLPGRKAGKEYNSQSPQGKFNIGECNIGGLAGSDWFFHIDATYGGRDVGPFQQQRDFFNHTPPHKLHNPYGTSTSRKAQATFLPDEMNGVDMIFQDVANDKRVCDLKLTSEMKWILLEVAHNGGSGVMWREIFGETGVPSRDKRQKCMEGLMGDIFNPKVMEWAINLEKKGISVTGSYRTFSVLAMVKLGWKLPPSFCQSYSTGEGTYYTINGREFKQMYPVIFGGTPPSVDSFISQYKANPTIKDGAKANGNTHKALWKSYGDCGSWMPYITLSNVVLGSTTSRLTYGKMLKSLGLTVDPTNPSTYLVGGNGNYTPPKGQGNVGNGLAKERDIICTEAKRICDAHIMYKYGGTDDSGYDCSGLVMHCYAKAGIKVPRTSQDQFKACKDSGMVFRDDKLVKPGDMVFFGDDNNPGHVALVKGVHANGEVYTYEAVATGKPCQSKPVRKRYGKQFTLYGRPKELVDLDNLTGSGGQFKPAGLTTVTPSGQASETVDYVNSKYKLCKASEMTWYYGDGKNLTSVYCGNNSSAWNQIGAYGYKDGFPLFAQGQYDRSGLKPRGSRNLPGTGCGIFSLASSLHAIGFGRADNPGIPAKIRECILKYGKNGYLHPYALDMYITSHGAWYVPGAGMTGAFDSIMRNLGLSVKPIANTDKRTTTNNVIEELKKGHPVIASFGPSTFSMYKLDSLNNKQVSYLGKQAVTRGGHYITLYSYGEYKTKDGKTIKGCALVDSSNYRRNPSTNEVIVDTESIYEPKSKGISWFALQYPIKGLSGETQDTDNGSEDDDGGYIDQDFFLDDSTIHTGTMSDAMALIRPTSSEDTGFIDITGKRLDQLGMFIGTDCKFLNGNTCLVFSKTGGIHYELYADGGKFKNIRIGQWNRLSDILDSRDVVIMVKAYTYIDGKKVYTGMYGEVD